MQLVGRRPGEGLDVPFIYTGAARRTNRGRQAASVWTIWLAGLVGGATTDLLCLRTDRLRRNRVRSIRIPGPAVPAAKASYSEWCVRLMTYGST
jgi:hypothetical protein